MKKYITLLIFVNISVFGSALTSFSFGIWLLKNIDATYLFTLIAFFGMAPSMILGPMIGRFVDQWDKKKVIIGGQICSAFISMIIIWLYSTDSLQPWHIMISAFVGSICGAFSSQAFYITAIQLVSTKDLIRVNGLSQASSSFLSLGVPVLSPLLFNLIGLQGVFMIDLVTFGLFIAVLLTIKLNLKPIEAPVTQETDKSITSDGETKNKKEVWVFFTSHKGFLWYLGYMFLIDFFFAMSQSLFGPMVMDFSDESAYSMVAFSSGIGLVIGGLVIGMNRKDVVKPVKRMIIGCLIMGGVFCSYFFPVNIYLVVIAAFLIPFVDSFLNSFYGVLWQVTVPGHMHGRVLGYRNLIVGAAFPLAFLLSGFIVDWGVQPLLLKHFPEVIAYYTGSAKSSAIAIMYAFSGVMIIILSLFASKMSVFNDLDDLYLSSLSIKDHEGPEPEKIPSKELHPILD